MKRRDFLKQGLAAAGAMAVSSTPPRADAGPTPQVHAHPALDALRRRHLSLNADWRFHRGDPDGVSGRLLYDVRPDPKDVRNAGPTEAKPAGQPQTASPALAVLKPWILPTGNRFLKDPARHAVRPPGNPGGEAAFVQSGFEDDSWQRVNLPHDWAIEGPFNPGDEGVGGGMGRLPSPGVGWYRKTLDIPATDAGRSVFLDVDGAMSYAAVWLNGMLVGGWPYGYASWRVDLTPHLVPGGPNQLVLRLDNPPESSRWYPGGGLYRDVWLITVSPVHVGQWGTHLTTPQVSASSAKIALEVTVDNDSPADGTVDVATRIYALDAEGRRTGGAVAEIAAVPVPVTAGANATVKGSVTLAHPRLWGPPPQQTPHRYVAVTTVAQRGREIDQYETRFGIRALDHKPDGIYINGERIPINGVNNHHDLGALGAAFSVRAAERQLEILREMGCNAIRMCHNPPAPGLLELTDRLGFLVMDEIFDVWSRQKTPLDFHLIFPDWHEQDLRAFLRRDRNCPSVVLWSVGNEVGDQFTGPGGAAVAQSLIAIAHDEDPTRPATASMNVAPPDSPFAAAVDVISLNYQGEGIRAIPGKYPAFREKFPDRVILSSENAAALSARGEYLFPVLNGISGPVRDGSGGDPLRHQVSAYELYAADFGSSADKVFAAQDGHPYVAGGFVWSGWDYLGEPTPYDDARSSYFGIIDLAGFPKDRFFLYQSHWRPDLPMAHLLPHWTWPERAGQVTPVHVFTSGDEAELFLNGRSLGRRRKEPGEYRLRWDDVIYEPGELRVVASKGGKEWAGDVRKTAGAPARLALSPDRSVIRADGRDLSFVTLRVVDAHGLPAPRANSHIRFEIEGPGEIVATDNGDPTSFEPFPSPERSAFNGLALVVVRAKSGRPGTIRLRAESDSLQAASFTLQGVDAE